MIDSLQNPVLSRRFDGLGDEFSIRIEPFSLEQAQIPRRACRDYGSGSSHAADLNLGDCFSYALARSRREPLLYQDDDCVHTDLRRAVKSS